MMERPGTHRILVIDDNPAIHDDFRKILAGPAAAASAFSQAKNSLFGSAPPKSKKYGYTIDSASQGGEGVERVREAMRIGQPYTLAFVDIRMPPGLDGIETVGRLWQQDPDLQVVLCTAYSDYSWDEILEKLERHDSLVILKKPFDNIEVLQLAHALAVKWQLNRDMKAHLEGLDQAVRLRTAELVAANEDLQREIAERTSAEQALGETQALQRHLLENLPAGVIVVDPQTRVIELANHQAALMFGAPVSRIVGQRCHAFLCPALEHNCPVCDLHHQVDSSEREMVREDGTRLPVLKWVKRIQLGGREKLLECFIDESARKHAQLELRSSEAQNRALISAIPDLVFSNHRDGEFLTYHASDPKQMMMPPEEFLFRRPHEVMPAPLADQFVETIQLALNSGAVQEFTYVLPMEGGERCFEARVAPCTEDSVLTIVRDITARVRAEERHHHLQSQLAQAQKMESLGLLAGGVAHDMNNVLGAILLSATANIDDHPEGSRARRALDTIAKAATRGGDMVKGLLSLARQHPAEDREMDLNEVLLEEIHLLEHTTLSRVDFVVDLAPDLRPIRGDSNALAHTFMNLFVNALDAIPERGRITVRSRNTVEGWIEVLVEDSGTGMPPAVLERAMEPFFTTKGIGKGTGLGLSMAYSTVKAHGGRFEIRSEPGRGTRVQMRFPAKGAGTPEPGPAAEARSAPSGSLTVLLVDDDELILASMRTALEALGHSAVLAATGEEALVMLENGLQADVVILDMNMPGLGGVGTFPRIHALRPGLPILLATGRADQTVLDMVQNAPWVTLMPKPFSLELLKTKLRSLVAPWEA